MNYENKHSKGPWSVTKAEHTRNIYTENGSRLLCIVGNWFGKPEEEHQANVRLIAAAPDLLQRLQAAMALLDPRRISPVNPTRLDEVREELRIGIETGTGVPYARDSAKGPG